MSVAEKSIPIYDLCALHSALDLTQLHRDVVGGPFANYLSYRKQLLVSHRHTFYHVLLFTKGSGIQTIDFEQYKICPGLIYFMIPGQVHKWEFSGDVDGYVVNFSENIFRSFISNAFYLEQFPFFRGIASDSVLHLKGGELNEVVHFFELLLNEINKKDQFSVDMVCFQLMSLFISITRHNPAQAVKQIPDQKQMTLYNFRKLVNEHYAQHRLPKYYAALLHISLNRLNAITKELLDKPAGELIRERILLEAKRLLVNAELNISEIAYQLNFTDNSYFTKFFKKYELVTPEEFRRHQMRQ